MDFNALIEANKQLQLHRAYDANLYERLKLFSDRSA